MAGRLDGFFEGSMPEFGWNPKALLALARNSARAAAFFYLDVKPALEARRKKPEEDIISHLLSRGYSDAEILIECASYGGVGRATTREFISVAAWHMLEQPALRERYLDAEEEERHDLLAELLRLEPVIGRLYRRATADLRLDDGEVNAATIPSGSLIALDLCAANADESTVGKCPLELVPVRRLLAERVGARGNELRRRAPPLPGILRRPAGVRRLPEATALPRRAAIERKPSVSWNDLLAGYKLRGFTVALS